MNIEDMHIAEDRTIFTMVLLVAFAVWAALGRRLKTKG